MVISLPEEEGSRGPGSSWIPVWAKVEVTFAVNEKRHAGTLPHLQEDKWPPGRGDASVAPAGLCRSFVLRRTSTRTFLYLRPDSQKLSITP